MPNPEFIELVAQMRATQKQYFKTRDPVVMDRAKALEREVDAAIAEYRRSARQLALPIEVSL